MSHVIKPEMQIFNHPYKHCVYVVFKRKTGVPVYVGQTTNPKTRWYCHTQKFDAKAYGLMFLAGFKTEMKATLAEGWLIHTLTEAGFDLNNVQRIDRPYLVLLTNANYRTGPTVPLTAIEI